MVTNCLHPRTLWVLVIPSILLNVVALQVIRELSLWEVPGPLPRRGTKEVILFVTRDNGKSEMKGSAEILLLMSDRIVHFELGFCNKRYLSLSSRRTDRIMWLSRTASTVLYCIVYVYMIPASGRRSASSKERKGKKGPTLPRCSGFNLASRPCYFSRYGSVSSDTFHYARHNSQTDILPNQHRHRNVRRHSRGLQSHGR